MENINEGLLSDDVHLAIDGISALIGSTVVGAPVEAIIDGLHSLTYFYDSFEASDSVDSMIYFLQGAITVGSVFMPSAFQSISIGAKKSLSTLKNPPVSNLAKSAIKTVSNNADSLYKYISDFIVKTQKSATTKVKGLDKYFDLLVKKGGKITDDIKYAVNFIVNMLSYFKVDAKSIGNFLMSVGKGILDGVGFIIKGLWSLGTFIIKKLIKPVLKLGKYILDFIYKTVKAVVDFVKSFQTNNKLVLTPDTLKNLVGADKSIRITALKSDYK